MNTYRAWYKSRLVMLAITQIGAGYTVFVTPHAEVMNHIRAIIPLPVFIMLCGVGSVLMLVFAWFGLRLNGFTVFPLGLYLIQGAYTIILKGGPPFNAFMYIYLFVDILWMIAYDERGSSSLIDWIFCRLVGNHRND